MRRLGLALFLLLFFIGLMPMSGGNFSATTVSTSDGPRENDGILDTGLPLKLHDSQATTASIYQNGTALWNQTYDGSGDEYVQSVVECGNGGFALAGYTNSFGASSQAGWLVRTDALGNHLWNQTYDGPNVDFLYSVVECSDGGFALAGNTMSFGVSSMAGWLVRTDEDGNLLWNMTYDAPFHEHFDMLVEVSDGGFAICGTTDSYGASNFAGWLLRTDSAGNHQWNMTFDGPNDEQFNAIIESTDGGFALVGITDSFGVSMQDGWLVRTASDGSHLWNQTYSTPNYDELYDLAECEDGTFALVGLANSTGFDGGGWLIKTDSDGNHLWNKTYDGSDMDGILSVVESKYGGLALGGVKDYGMSGSMGWLIRTDDEGNQYWNQTYGSSGYDCLYSIVELRGGGFVIAGITDGFGVSLNAAWLVRAGPSYDWIQTYDRTWADDVYDVIECQNGGFAIAGYSTKPPYQAWLIRTDMDGNQLWDRRYGFINHTTAKAIIECSTGGFLLAGFMDTLMPGGRAAFLLRTDAGGNTLWNWTFDGPGADGLSDLVECSSGGYAACGWTSSYGTTRAMWLVRFDSDGNHLWNYTYNRAKEDYGFGLVECSGGGFALTGNTQGAGSTSFSWLVRTDADGVHLWNQTYSAHSSSYTYDLVECTSSGFALAGWASAGWLIRTDSVGNLLWDETYSGTKLTSIVESDDGGFALGGYTYSPYDAWLMRTDAAGNKLWALTFGGPQPDDGASLVLCTDGGYALVGGTSSYGVSNGGGMLVRVPELPVWLETPSDQTLEYGSDLLLDLNAEGTAPLDKWWLSDTSYFGIDNEGIITNSVTVPVSDYGIEVWVNDTLGYNVSYTFTVTVEDTTLPTWDQLPSDRIVEFGDDFVYNLNASDLSSINHYAVSDTANFTIDSTGLLTNNTALVTGVYSLQVWAFDPYLNNVSVSFLVTVQDTTSPTWMTTPTDQIHELGTPFTYDVEATDFGGISHYWINDTVNFHVSVTGVITNITQLTIDVYWLEVRAYDNSGLYCFATFRIIVLDTLPPQWITPPTNQQSELGFTFIYDLDAYDPIGIQEWGLNDTTYFSIDANGIITNATYLPVGTYGLHIWVRDNLGQTTNSYISVLVQDTTAPVWIVTPTDQILNYGEVLGLQLEAVDFSEFYWTIDNTVEFAITSNGWLFNITTIPVGTQSLEVTLTDEYGNSVSVSFTVTVLADTTSTTSTTTTTTGTTVPPPSLEMVLASIGMILGGIIIVIIVVFMRKRKT